MSQTLVRIVTFGLAMLAFGAFARGQAPPAAPDGAPTAASGGAPTLAPGTEGWCAVAASLPPGRFAAAAAVAAELRAAGHAQAGIYETRDFTDLAWGLLTVLAGPPAPKEAVTATARALKKAGVKAYAKPCAVGEGGARPRLAAADLTPAPALPTAALARERLAAPPDGCFAWSPARAVALCVVGHASMQRGGSWRLAFVGAPADEGVPLASWEAHSEEAFEEHPLTLAGAALDGLARRVAAAGFVALDGPARRLEPNGALHWGEPRFHLRWERRKLRTIREESGSWDEHSDRLVVGCGGKGAAERTFAEDRIEGAAESDHALVYAIPGGRHVLVLRDRSWGLEGEYGGDRAAWVIDLAAECAAPAL